MSRPRHPNSESRDERRLWKADGKPRRIFQALKTVLLVSLVASLIWTWAESESLKTQEVSSRITFDLGIASQDPTGGIVLVPLGSSDAASSDTLPVTDPGFMSVHLRLEGPTAAVDSAARRLASGTITISPGLRGVPRQPGIADIDLREAIASSPILESLGVAVLETQPERIGVRVLRMVNRQMPVRAAAAGVDLDGEPQIDISTVSVLLPASLAALLPESAAAIAVPGASERAQLRADVAITVRCLLQLDPADCRDADQNDLPQVRFSPESAMVTMKVRRDIGTITLHSVPVWIAIAGDDGRGWDVEPIDNEIQNVVVTGPSEVIERLRAGRLTLRAQVELTRADLESGLVSKPFSFVGLPAGPELDIKAAKDVIGIKIRRR